MKQWKKLNYRKALDEIILIEDDGHKVERFTDWHWRIDKEIDLWPSAKKYKKNGQVLTYEKIADIFK